MPDSPNMPDNISILDQALGLAYAIPNFKRELKQDFISRLFENPEAAEVPEVKEELWDKEAGDSEMQTEKPKSLHGKKYDRRMKFNTALDRSEHQTTREGPAQMKNNDPEWMKEAAEKLAISEGLALRALSRAAEGATDAQSAFKALSKYPRTNLRAQGVADPAIRREALEPFKELFDLSSQMSNKQMSPEAAGDIFSRFSQSQDKLNAILGKQAEHSSKIAVDPDFSFNGQTGREQVVSIEDELLKTPPLPIGDTIFYSEPNKPVMQKECAEDIADKVIAKNRKKKPKSTGSFFDPALGIGAATAIGASKAQKKVTKNLIEKQLYPTDWSTGFRNSEIQGKLKKSIPEDFWTSKNRQTPEIFEHISDPRLDRVKYDLMGQGPHHLSTDMRRMLTKNLNPGMTPEDLKNIKPYVYTPGITSPEILSHEIGHSIQHPNFMRLSMPGRVLMRPKASIPLNIAALVSHARGQGEDPEKGKVMAYGTAGLGAGAAAATIANEIDASMKGTSLMRKAGLKPRFGHAYGGNATYALGAAAASGIPVSLAVKRFLKARKAKKLEEASQTAEPIMEQAQQESGENL